MRTTLDIDDELLARAKVLAAREQTSLTRLIEQGITLRLRAREATRHHSRPVLPVYPGKGGLRPHVKDTLSHRALLDAADDVS